MSNCFGRRLSVMFLFVFCPYSSSLAQEPESPTVAAVRKNKSFASEWFGIWKGEVQSRSPSGKQDAFQMELRIAPTEKRDLFQWTIIYEGAQGRSERLYTLVAKDLDNGRFVIDENNGILLDATLIGDTFSEHFVVNSQRIWTTTRLLQTSSGREIHFELSSADESQANKSGGKNGTPEVSSLRLGNQQRAILKPVESNDASKPEINDKLVSWKKLETEAYRGKQDDIYFLNERLGWYVNGAGKIFKTTDAGATWAMQLHKPGTFFRCIAFVDEMRGFAGNIGPGYFPNVTDDAPLYETSERFVAKTTDGGKTWSEMPLVSDHKVREFGVGFLDAKTGWVGAVPNGFETNDGGATWKAVDMGDAVNKIQILETDSGHVGYAIGISVHRMEVLKK